MAGIESTANTTSVVSTRMSTANSGVASSLPVRRVNIFWPSYSGVDGTTRRTSLRTKLFSGWTSAPLCRATRKAVMSRKAPKT